MPTTLATLRDRHNDRLARPMRVRRGASRIPDVPDQTVVDLFTVTTDATTGALTQQNVFVAGFHRPDDPNVIVV